MVFYWTGAARVRPLNTEQPWVKTKAGDRKSPSPFFKKRRVIKGGSAPIVLRSTILVIGYRCGPPLERGPVQAWRQFLQKLSECAVPIRAKTTEIAELKCVRAIELWRARHTITPVAQ